MPLLRADLQVLAQARLDEADALLAAAHHRGAYYLAGYAVEIGLKAVIARQFKSDRIPDWALTERFKTHRLSALIEFADLVSDLDVACGQQRFNENWAFAVAWSVDSRYDRAVTVERATRMVEAIGHERFGVLRWIKTHW